ncbi:MAG: hypothetical protein R3C99_27415 [Pirellulaceae bacterium]
MANATGCSSIFGGNLPTTPWSVNGAQGREPAWSNSLFEDNAEFGLGMRLAADQRTDYVHHLLRQMASPWGRSGWRAVELATNDRNRSSRARRRVALLRRRLAEGNGTIAVA